MVDEQPTVLIIDDSPEDRATFRRFLLQDLQYTYRILEEEAGEQGLELCQQLKPDVILLDFMLPDIDGLEFLKTLKTQIGNAHLPVVMLTGQGSEAIAVEAIKSGAQNYLVKGTTTAESLRLAVHSVVEQTHLLGQLERSERRFRLAVEHFPSTFVIYDAERRIQFMNTHGIQNSGYSEAAILNHRDEELFPPEITDAYLPTLKRAVATRASQSVEYFLPNLELTLITTYVPLVNGAGNIEQVLGITEDISDRKRMEAAREQLLVQEQAANRAKDEFLAMVSHELRNPLGAILGYTQLLRTRKLNDGLFERACETIERNAKLQAQLIDDLLDLSRITVGKLRLALHPVHLVSMIEAAIDTVRLSAQAKDIQIHAALTPEIGPILGDANRLQQVIWNLLSNAIKFTPEGGEVMVYLERVEGDRGDGGASLSVYAQITVADTGQGISPEFLPHLFERFRQGGATDHKTGLGLGLAIVRHLVELHGGTVEAGSPGQGPHATDRALLN
jgi:PAS domain S-box-containing protein